jgi:hypothetical protein
MINLCITLLVVWHDSLGYTVGCRYCEETKYFVAILLTFELTSEPKELMEGEA